MPDYKDINTVPNITAIDNSDQIFMSDGKVAIRKIDFAVLSKAIIEQYNGTTLAGSAKTLKAAFNALNDELQNKGFIERRLLTSSDDMDTLLLSGIYRVTRGTSNWMPSHWPISTSGGTILVFRWSAYGANSTLGTLQFVLTEASIWIRWGGATGITWADWIEYKDYHTILKPISKEFDSSEQQNVNDYVIKDTELYKCIVDSAADEDWNAGKFRKTSVANELTQLAAASSVANHNVDLGYYQFPITWDYARTSEGNIIIESNTTVTRRILSDYLSTENIDALKVINPFFNIGLAFYDANKQWISNGSVSLSQVNPIVGEKIVFLPRKPGYIRICMVFLPDQDPNAFDMAEVTKNHLMGIKFLMTSHCDADTNTLRTRIPFGIGNFLDNSNETYDYGQYRMRSSFIKTKDYSSIYVNNDSSYSYTITVRYMNSSLDVVSSITYVDQLKIPIEHTHPYFCLQVYNTANPNSTPLSPEHAITHIELANDLGDAGSTSIVALNDEKTMEVKLQQISTTYSASTTLKTQPLTLLHFSDLHANTTALTRIIEFANRYDSYINDIIHTGDTLNSSATNFAMGNVTGGEKILNVLGNHDTWDSSVTPDTAASWRALSEADSYTRFINPYKADWETNGTLSIPSNKCYYYKDYTNAKVRLIVLDCMHENSAQLTWLNNTLTSAKSANMHVLIANHVKMGKSEDIIYLNSGFDNPVFPRSSTPSYNFPNYAGADYANAVKTFAQGGGIVVGWLCGHMHCDTLGTWNGILNIGITTAGDVNYSRTYDSRVIGTKSYDAFNVVGVDTDKKYLYLVRVGLDYNSIMRKTDTLCWDYNNHVLVHTS